MEIKREEIGKKDGSAVYLITIINDHNVSVSIMNYGGIIKSIKTPDNQGNIADIVLGFDRLDDYMQDHPYFGTIVGRYANRIKNASFEIEGTTYHLPKNHGDHHLHGGVKGFDKVVWEVEDLKGETEAGVRLRYFSKDGEEGYPGNLQTEVIYILTNDNELKIEYFASTDKKTHINYTNHSYFNLTGCKNNIMGHKMLLKSNKITEVDKDAIPTGKILDIKDTAYDFTEGKAIGKDIEQTDNGYDHNYVLDNDKGQLIHIATVTDPKTGRTLDMKTTEPGVQFYTGNYLSGIQGKNGISYKNQFGFCLEAQHYPDSPNQHEFPSTLLKPKDDYYQLTIYKFGVVSS
jgi:aldose 1-epimerase